MAGLDHSARFFPQSKKEAIVLALDKAKALAIMAGNAMLPYCDRLNVAGSIRRSKYEVKDIEIVCLPKRILTGAVDLFGLDTRAISVHPDFVSVVNSLGKVIMGKSEGRQMKIEMLTNMGGQKTIMLDLFMPVPHDYFRQYAIRTGSSDYSQKVIATAWVKNGWVGTKDGLRLEIECAGTKTAEGKTIWKCTAEEPTLPPAWESEEEFFKWLRIEALPPRLRHM